MKLLHTADWHLGQSFFEYDRRFEHIEFLKWLQQQIKSYEIDVLLIAGDIFDSPNPSAESQKLYYSFLKDISANNPNLQVIIIAGNHDSAARLEAPNPLLEGMDIYVRGVIKRNMDGDIDFKDLIIPLKKGGYCMAIPYLRQGDYPCAENYAIGVQQMYNAVFESLPANAYPIIAMGHLQATGSEISVNDRSERTIIGGLESISPESFSKDIAYTALGHLHRGQRISYRENIRYSGTPIPMSFAEKNNKQSIVLVEISDQLSKPFEADNSNIKIEKLEYNTPVKLISIPKEPGSLMDLISEIERLPNGKIDNYSPFLEVKVLIIEPEPSLRHTIEEALEGKSVRLARIVAISPQKEYKKSIISYDELRSINPMDMAEDIFAHRFGGEKMPEKMKELLNSVIQEEQR